MKLYEILREIEELSEALIDPETGEINEEVFDRLNELEVERETKEENIGLLIKNLRAEADMVSTEKANLDKRIKTLKNKADRIERWYAEQLDGKEISTAKLKVTWRGSERVEIDEVRADIPDKYMTVKTTATPDKKLLKEAIKAGEKIKGVEVVKRNNIQIK